MIIKFINLLQQQILNSQKFIIILHSNNYFHHYKLQQQRKFLWVIIKVFHSKIKHQKVQKFNLIKHYVIKVQL